MTEQSAGEIIRQLTPSLDDCAYFQTSGFSPKPAPVTEEVARWLAFEDQGPALPWIHERMQALLEESRSAGARCLGAEADEIMLNENTTIGINLVAWGVDWRPGDNMILTDHEHPGNRIPWYNLATRYGIEPRFLQLCSEPAVMLERFRDLLDGRTRLASLSHVSRRTGVRLPAREIVREAHERGVPVLLDGAQAVGAIPVDVNELGCDFYTASGHKYLMGPQGTGIFYVRREMLDWLKPSWLGSHSQEMMDLDGHMALKASARRFEFGTRTLAVFAGLRQAIEMWESIGWSRVYDALARYTAEMKCRLLGLPGLELLTPLPYERSAGIVTFRIAGIPSATICRSLWEDERVFVGGLELDEWSVRISTHAFNTVAECNRLIAGLRRILSLP